MNYGAVVSISLLIVVFLLVGLGIGDIKIRYGKHWIVFYPRDDIEINAGRTLYGSDPADYEAIKMWASQLVSSDKGWEFLTTHHLSAMSGDWTDRRIHIPYLPVLLILMPYPVFWFLSWRVVRYRTRHHLCVSCGYDLRATPERCPECGVTTDKANEVSP